MRPRRRTKKKQRRQTSPVFSDFAVKKLLSQSDNKTLTVTDAILSTVDLLMKNHLQQENGSVRLVSSYSYMDTVSTKKILIGSIFCLLTIMLIPLAISGHFSVFIYHLVVEKEEKTRFMMQVHGMKLSFYMLVNYLMYFSGSFLSCAVLWMAGYHLLELPFFVMTSPSVLIILFALWAHCQICLALLFQTFPLSVKITSSKITSFRISVLDFLSCWIDVRQRNLRRSDPSAAAIPPDSTDDFYAADQQALRQDAR